MELERNVIPPGAGLRALRRLGDGRGSCPASSRSASRYASETYILERVMVLLLLLTVRTINRATGNVAEAVRRA
jgi:hypothetical protein